MNNLSREVNNRGAKFCYDTDTSLIKSGTSESFKLLRWAILYLLFPEKQSR